MRAASLCNVIYELINPKGSDGEPHGETAPSNPTRGDLQDADLFGVVFEDAMLPRVITED